MQFALHKVIGFLLLVGSIHVVAWQALVHLLKG